MPNAAMLNEIAALLNTTDKTVVLSAAIKGLTDLGVPVRQAFDVVLGKGAFEKLAGEVYDQLTANA